MPSGHWDEDGPPGSHDIGFALWMWTRPVRDRRDEVSREACRRFVENSFRDVPAMLEEIDFLRKLLSDLKQDSTAYARGVEDGKAAQARAAKPKRRNKKSFLAEVEPAARRI